MESRSVTERELELEVMLRASEEHCRYWEARAQELRISLQIVEQIESRYDRPHVATLRACRSALVDNTGAA